MKNKLLIIIFLISSLIFGQTETVIFGLDDPARMHLSGNILYYSDTDEVLSIDITEENPTPNLIISGLSKPVGLESKDNFLYVAQFDAGNVIKLDLTDSNPVPEIVTTTGSSPNHLLIVDDMLYYSSNNGGAIFELDLVSGASDATTIITGLEGPLGLAFKNDLLFIAEGLTGKIYSYDTTDSSAEEVEIVSGLDRPVGIEFYGNDLYAADLIDQRIVKINVFDASITIEEIVINLFLPRDLTFYESTMYICEENKISKLELPLSVDEFDINNVTLFPNPTIDELSISNLKTSRTFEIIDSVGRVVKKGVVNPNDKIITSSLSQGYYLIRLENANEILRFLKI